MPQCSAHPLPAALPCSGGARAALFKLAQQWNDPDIDFNGEGVGDYEGAHRAAKYCYAVYGCEAPRAAERGRLQWAAVAARGARLFAPG